MTDKTNKEKVLELLEKSFRIVRPWKMHHTPNKEYEKGWNDCIKTLKKREKSYLEFVKTL